MNNKVRRRKIKYFYKMANVYNPSIPREVKNIFGVMAEIFQIEDKKYNLFKFSKFKNLKNNLSNRKDIDLSKIIGFVDEDDRFVKTFFNNEEINFLIDAKKAFPEIKNYGKYSTKKYMVPSYYFIDIGSGFYLALQNLKKSGYYIFYNDGVFPKGKKAPFVVIEDKSIYNILGMEKFKKYFNDFNLNNFRKVIMEKPQGMMLENKKPKAEFEDICKEFPELEECTDKEAFPSGEEIERSYKNPFRTPYDPDKHRK